MTEAELFSALGGEHQILMDAWALGEGSMGLFITSDIRDNMAITRQSHICTEDDVKAVAVCLVKMPCPVKRTLLFKSWMLPGADKEDPKCLVRLSDGMEYANSFKMEVSRTMYGEPVWEEVDQDKEHLHMELAPEVIWKAYSTKLVMNALGVKGEGYVIIPRQESLPIVDGLKVDPIPMPKVGEGDIII